MALAALLKLGLEVSLALGLGLALALPAAAQVRPAAVQQGYDLLGKGWINDAIAAFQSVLQRNPQSLEARLGLAMAYQRAGQDANAWTAYQAVLAQDPDNAQALSAVGTLGGYRAEWQAAGIEALTRLLAQDSNNRPARAQRALLYGYQGRFSEALADYEPLLVANPSPETLLGAAQIYTYSGDYSQGVTLFGRYLAGQNALPDSAAAAYALALQETGQVDQAIALLRPRLQPPTQGNLVAVQNRTALAVAYGAAGQLDQALALLKPLEGAPENALPLARALSTLGRQQGDPALFEQATQLYQQALAATPSPSYGLRLEAADVLSEWPDTQALALSQLQQLAQDYPGDVGLQVRSLTLAYGLQRLTAEALAAQLEALLSPLPQEALQKRAVAQALVRLDQPDPALLGVYEDAIANGLTEPLLLFRVAQMHLAENNQSAALTALEQYRATPTGRADLEVELLIADLERQAGDLEASASRYEALIAAQPSAQITATALRGLAAVRTLQNQPEQALSAYDTALQRDPDNLAWQAGRATLAYQLEQLSEAEAAQVLTQWLAANPGAESRPPAEVWQLAAALPAATERAALYQALLAVDPEAAGIRWRSIELLAQSDAAQAQAQLEALIAQQPDDPTVYFWQGSLAQQRGDLETASRAYETILTLAPEDVGAKSALAGVRFQQQRYGEAKSLYEAVLAQEPSNAGARLAIAELNAAQGYPLAALEQFQTLPSGPTTPQVQQRVQDLQTDLLRRRGFHLPWERY